MFSLNTYCASWAYHLKQHKVLCRKVFTIFQVLGSRICFHTCTRYQKTDALLKFKYMYCRMLCFHNKKIHCKIKITFVVKLFIKPYKDKTMFPRSVLSTERLFLFFWIRHMCIIVREFYSCSAITNQSLNYMYVQHLLISCKFSFCDHSPFIQRMFFVYFGIF